MTLYSKPIRGVSKAALMKKSNLSHLYTIIEKEKIIILNCHFVVLLFVLPTIVTNMVCAISIISNCKTVSKTELIMQMINLLLLLILNRNNLKWSLESFL